MEGLITSLGAWSWLILGLALVAAELLAPGVFLLWLGLAALAVGLLSLVIVWSWQVQIVAFTLFSLAAIPLWRRMARHGEPEAGSEFLNRRAEALVGRVFTLDKPIVDGSGTIRVDDTVWRVSGPDCASGSRVKVVRAEGARLTVELA